MVITMIGSGYVGLVSGVCLADTGHTVICADINKEKIAMLNNGQIPIYEPGLTELIAKNIKEERLTFSCDITESVKKSDVIFIAVGTPMGSAGEADLSYVFAAAKTIGKALNGYKVIVTKSTVPVGTAEKVKNIIKENTKHDFDVASNPEFLKEGTAIDDFMKPDRIVIGVDSDRARKIMENMYETFTRTFHPIIVMDVKSSEMTKYAANCFLATKISFINEIANICEKTGANIDNIRKGIGADKRIGYEFLFPGVGYGGSCFPKDVRALIFAGQEYGYKSALLTAVEDVNFKQKSVIAKKILNHYSNDIKNLTFAVLGLSFKPKTDDMREAPSITIINSLLEKGAKISAFDPVAVNEAKKIFGDKITYAKNPYAAAENTDALILVTEWNEFRNLSFKKLKETMKGLVVFDGRNIYNPEEAKQEGFTYYAIGRN